ncbi:MAG TPA: hypothetical protein VGR74_12110, partial [Actinomycetota bacterium]|nr:hypothetical protein [Actinomycetota bacterium]
MTQDEYRRGPAEDRLARVVAEVRAVTAQVKAMPGLTAARRDALRLAMLELVGATKALTDAVVEAAHRAPA